MRPIIGVENRSAQEVFYIMCDRITSALRSATPMPGVKVLEWFPVEAICTREKAQALGGHYSVVEFDKDRPDRHFATNIDLGGLAFVFLLEPDMEFGGTRPKRFSTIEAAKAAAQADYEARIISALTATPMPGDWVLVPREPTDAMHRAGIETMMDDWDGEPPVVTRIFDAMLAAAPPAREISEAEVERAARALADGLDGPYPDPDAWIEYQGAARAALEAARSPS
jgi:hypothetical protein